MEEKKRPWRHTTAFPTSLPHRDADDEYSEAVAGVDGAGTDPVKPFDSPQWHEYVDALEQDLLPVTPPVVALTDDALWPTVAAGGHCQDPPASAAFPPTLLEESFLARNRVSSMAEFHACLAEHLGPDLLSVLEPFLGTSAFVIAGGAMAACFTRKAPGGGFDLFRVSGDDSALSAEAFEYDLDNLVQKLCLATQSRGAPADGKREAPTLVLRTAGCIILQLPLSHSARRINIITRCFPSVGALLQTFDLPSACVAYAGSGRFLATPIGVLAYRHRLNVVDLRRAKGESDYSDRLARHYAYGFGIVLPHTTRDKIRTAALKAARGPAGEDVAPVSAVTVEIPLGATVSFRIGVSIYNEKVHHLRLARSWDLTRAAAEERDALCSVRAPCRGAVPVHAEEVTSNNLHLATQHPVPLDRVMAEYRNVAGASGVCRTQVHLPPEELAHFLVRYCLELDPAEDAAAVHVDRGALRRVLGARAAEQLAHHLEQRPMAEWASVVLQYACRLAPIIQRRLALPPPNFSAADFARRNPPALAAWYGADLYVPNASVWPDGASGKC